MRAFPEGEAGEVFLGPVPDAGGEQPYHHFMGDQIGECDSVSRCSDKGEDDSLREDAGERKLGHRHHARRNDTGCSGDSRMRAALRRLARPGPQPAARMECQ